MKDNGYFGKRKREDGMNQTSIYDFFSIKKENEDMDKIVSSPIRKMEKRGKYEENISELIKNERMREFRSTNDEEEVHKERKMEGRVEEGVEDSDEEDKENDERSPFIVERNKKKETYQKKEEKRYKWLEEVEDSKGRKSEEEGYDKSTLYIPNSAWQMFTPFERQYWEVKKEYYDCIVFFKKGKFYELYENDADVGVRLLDLKLIRRVNMRMVGIPEMSFDDKVVTFIDAGYKVVKVDQLETSIGKNMRERETKNKKDKLIQREVSSILTSGTVINPAHIGRVSANYCAVIKSVDQSKDKIRFALCFVDVSTAEFYYSEFEDDVGNFGGLFTFICQIQPREVLYRKGIDPAVLRFISMHSGECVKTPVAEEEFEYTRGAREATRSVQQCMNKTYQDLLKTKDAICCFAVLAGYLVKNKIADNVLPHSTFSAYDPISSNRSLILDHCTLTNLEIFSNTYDNSVRGTLFELLDKCKTSFGKRLLRRWICWPLRNLSAIKERQDVIEHLMRNGSLLHTIGNILANLPDLERLVSRVCSIGCRIKDFLNVINTFSRLSDDIEKLKVEKLPALLEKKIQSYPNLRDEIQWLQVGFDYSSDDLIIPLAGSDPDYDLIIAKLSNIENRLEEYRVKQSRRLNTSVQYKHVGKELFQLEISSDINPPPEFIQMSKTKTFTRYWTKETREFATEYQERTEQKNNALQTCFTRLIKKFAEKKNKWMQSVHILSEIDCLFSFTTACNLLGKPLCRPVVMDPVNSLPSEIECVSYRHPCTSQATSNFIPNSLSLGGSHPPFALITGPNMGGKSTLLRQMCLAIILAQLGLFIPAESCKLTLFDRIYTRIGSNDSIAEGESTFMVELSETSKILSSATPHSFVILDELGRGTSTFDGMGIAYSTLHYLTRYVRCTGMFSTHFHLLAKEFQTDPFVQLCYMNCSTSNLDITFFYQLVHGISSNSCGINVARLAGIPEHILLNAKQTSHDNQVACKTFNYSLRDLYDFLLLLKHDPSIIKSLISSYSTLQHYNT